MAEPEPTTAAEREEWLRRIADWRYPNMLAWEGHAIRRLVADIDRRNARIAKLEAALREVAGQAQAHALGEYWRYTNRTEATLKALLEGEGASKPIFEERSPNA